MKDSSLRSTRRGVTARAALAGLTTLSLWPLGQACTSIEVVAVEGGSVIVVPSSWTALVGDTATFSAEVRDDEGRLVPNPEVTWTSGNPSRLRVSLDGVVEALAPGGAEVRATALGVTGAASADIEPAPAIVADPLKASFVVEVGGDPRAPLQVAVTNGGGGLLFGLAATVEYATTQPTGWLSVSLSSTDAPATLTLEGHTSSLPVGTFDARVLLSSPVAPDGPLALTVEVIVTQDAAILDLVPGAVGFAAVAGGASPPPKTVQVLSGGTGMLGDLSLEVVGVEGPGGWLSATLSSPSAPAELLLTPDIGAVDAGTWRANVIVSAPGAVNSPRILPVTLSVEREPAADLEVVKTGPVAAARGDTVTYRLTTSNAGPGRARDVVVVDSLPEGVTVLSISSGGNRNGRAVTWHADTLRAGESQIDSVVVRIDASGDLTDVARVSSATPEARPSDNRTSLTTVVPPEADLSVVKTGPGRVGILETIEYVITVSNAGPDAALGVEIVDDLPSNVTYVSSTGGGVHSGGSVTWTFDSLGPSEAQTLTLTVRPPLLGGTVTNVVTGSSTTADPDTDDLRSSVETIVTLLQDSGGVTSGDGGG